VRLSYAQVRVLRLLREGPRETTKTTHHGYVSGATAEGLIRRGLAGRSYHAHPVLGSIRAIAITDAGRAEIDAYDRAENGAE
jgi:hypothetical protein